MLSFILSCFAPSERAKAARRRVLAAEPLESRQMLDGAGLVDVGAQPDGGLSDKIVYVHGGHGITETNSGWGYQRPLLLDMVEDLGNQDQMTFLANYLWDAGATVVPLRPVGNQVNEVVLDNDDLGVSFEGAWGNGSGSTYYGSPGDVRYGFATTSPVETAVATYRPDLPEAGFYPVYAWSPAGSNRAVDQLYRVRHSGGATEVTIDHSRVGNGLVYLGTYHFNEGTEGAVEISNRSDDAGKVVVADMIRFGNGMGDINRGNGVSGEPRENEAGIYWMEWHSVRAQGVPSSAYGTSTVSAPPRMAAYMNQAGVGTLSDRVFVSFHSNAGGGNARGVLGLLNGNNNPATATPNQFLLADTLAGQVNDDLVAQNGSFGQNWQNRTTVTLDRSDIEFGEINNQRINNEFDATIIETGFHDNQFDAQMLRDQRVRDAIAKATYQGIVDYFRVVDGGATPNVDAPPRVAELSAESSAPGEATLRWSPGAASSFGGSAATGYMVYASTDGLGFDGGTFVPGGGTTTHTITGLTAGETYYFRVAAVNTGGEAPDSEVVAVKPSASPEKVLIVNGFDRLDRGATPKDPFRGGPSTVDRVRVRGGNTYDYAIQVASAIEAAGATPAIATASNEAIASGVVSLSDYDAVVWIAGEESSADDTFNTDEQNAVAAYLTGGGKLFVSGAEIGWDLDNLNNGSSFYNNSLRADYVADDAGSYNATGAAGSIFEGLNLQFDDGSEVYNVEFADVISPLNGATTALTYGGGGGAAGIQYENGGTGEQLVMLGFPFETLVGESNQLDVMTSVLDYFGFATQGIQTASLVLDNDDGSPTYTETGGWITSGDPGADGGTQRFTLIGNADTAAWTGPLPLSGEAEVFVKYDAAANRASGVRYNVTVGGESRQVIVNQQQNDFSWVSLGTFENAVGSVTVTVDAEASTGSPFSLVIADQVRVDVRGQAGGGVNGDFNNNGVVDAADYTVYRDTLGQIVTPLTGADADGSGLVDEPDLAIWRATYGLVVPAAVSFATAPPAQSASFAPASSSIAEEESDAAFAALSSDPTSDRSLSSRADRDTSIDSHPNRDRALLLIPTDSEPVEERTTDLLPGSDDSAKDEAHAHLALDSSEKVLTSGVKNAPY
ncbi:AmiA-like protein [Planctomycetes bacterium MalM25]|nr:AmiA-like protein [Planctomycetes bacterium MalM25]